MVGFDPLIVGVDIELRGAFASICTLYVRVRKFVLCLYLVASLRNPRFAQIRTLVVLICVAA